MTERTGTVITEIDSLSKYIDEILSAHETKQADEIFFYRGHSHMKYKLVPSVMRSEETLKKEDFFFHQIRVRCPDEFRNCSHIDQLVKMQHYECPTRLLDVTGNPLVGLYFACKEYEKGKLKGSEDSKTTEPRGGSVFKFAIKQENLLYYDSARARMLSCLAGLTYEEKTQIRIACDTKMRKAVGKSDRETIRKGYGGDSVKRYDLFDASNNGKEVEKLYQTIKIEAPSFKKEMSAFDLRTSFFVQPLKANQRILKQDGAFLIFGLSTDEDDADALARKYVCQEFHISNQDKILKELDAVGINEAALFPEVDKVSSYLKNL